MDAIETFWANSYGAPGPPRSDPYYDYYGGGNCQEFEGGTYCPNGYRAIFTDVPYTHWAHRYIGWAAREGIIGGYPDGTFAPNNFVTRGQFSKMMVNGFSLATNTSGGPHFCDVAPGSTFYNYIETLYNQGVIGGYGGASCGYSSSYFYPGNNVSRGQTAKVVTLLAQNKGWLSINTNGGPDYVDVTSSDPFYQYVESLYNKGAIQYRREQDGAGNGGHFYVGWSATRAQIAMFLHELIYAVSPP